LDAFIHHLTENIINSLFENRREMLETSIDKKFMALFFALLIILIPAEFSIIVKAQYTPTYGSYTGGAAAGQYVTIRYIYGSDSISGFRKRTDNVIIVAQASLGSNTSVVAPSNLEVYYSGYALGFFQTCTKVSSQSGIYECKFTENSTGPASAESQTYTVNLVNGSNLITSTSSELVVDSKEPTIQSMTPSTTRTANPNVSLTFKVKDYAYSSISGVGLQSVTVTVDGATQYSYPETTGNGSANSGYNVLTAVSYLQKTVNLSLGTASGSKNICVSATDFFSQTKSQCTSVTIDTDAPTILSNTLIVVDSDGNPIDWLSDDEKTATIYLAFKGTDLKLSSIYGDFSDLSIYGDYSHVTPSSSCATLANNTYNCTFTVGIKVNQTRSYNLYFNVSDDLGNWADATLPYSINYDTDGPVATSFSTPYYYNGRYYIASSPVMLQVNVLEEGVGMNLSKAYLDLSQIGMSGSLKADNCTGSWSCYWGDISVPDAGTVSSLPALTVNVDVNGTIVPYTLEARVAEISFLASSMDDLGNTGNKTTFNLTVDVYKPTVLNKNISGVPQNSDFGNYTVVNDSIYIMYNVSDGSYVKMNVTAKDFINNFNETVDCTDNGDGTHICETIIGPITNEGYYEGTLHIQLIDLLGNVKDLDEKLKVYEIDEGTPDYWSGADAGCSPDPLDRTLVNRIASNIYCTAALSQKQTAEIFDLTGGDCHENTPSYDSSLSLGNVTTLSTFNWMGIPRDEPTCYINFKTSTFNARLNELHYECQLKVRSIVNNQKITRDYEEENITFNIGLYKMPLGDVNQTVWDEVDGLYDDYIGGAWNLVGYLQSFFALSEKLCKVGNSLINLFTALRSIGIIWSAATTGIAGTENTPVVGQTIVKPTRIASGEGNCVFDETAQETSKSSTKSIKDMFNWYCAFIGCKLAYGDKFGAVQQYILNYINWVSSFGGFTNYLTSLGTQDTAFVSSPKWEGATAKTPSAAQAQATKPQAPAARPSGVKGQSGDTVRVSPALDTNIAETLSLIPFVAATSTPSFYDNGGTQLKPGSLNVKESWILSLATLCIPGMIYNLEKWRQIQCTYGNCLISNARNSLPTTLCTSNKAFAECKFIYGPIFELVPFANFLSQIQNIIKNIMSNYLILIDYALYAACYTSWGFKCATCSTPETTTATTCEFTGGAPFYICQTYSVLKMAIDIYNDIKGYMADGYWDIDFGAETGSCKDFHENYDNLKECGTSGSGNCTMTASS
jgi:hypothetical protein